VASRPVLWSRLVLAAAMVCLLRGLDYAVRQFDSPTAMPAIVFRAAPPGLPIERRLSRGSASLASPYRRLVVHTVAREEVENRGIIT
jgi:hypothetical protein